MDRKSFLIHCTMRIGIYEARRGSMLMFTRAMPWAFKACTVGAVTTHAFSATVTNARQEHVLLVVSFLTLASVLPSIVSCVVDRTKTTAYIVHSALFLLCIHAAVLALETWHWPQYKVAVTQTCVLHLLWSQWRTLAHNKHILIYQGPVECILIATAVLSWSVCALMMPRFPVDILALVGLIFVGEVVGVAVSLLAAILAAVGDMGEACFTDKTS
jgi:hypothetical protein